MKVMRWLRINNLLILTLSIGFLFIQCKKSKKYCVDDVVCFETDSLVEGSDSVRFIFYLNEVVGKEVYAKGGLESIAVLNDSLLKSYYSNYRHLKYVGASLYAVNCAECHSYPATFNTNQKNNRNYTQKTFVSVIGLKHEELDLSDIELEAILEYLQPKEGIYPSSSSLLNDK